MVPKNHLKQINHIVFAYYNIDLHNDNYMDKNQCPTGRFSTYDVILQKSSTKFL